MRHIRQSFLVPIDHPHLRSSSSSRVRWRLLRCDLRSRSLSSSLCRCDLWLLRCLRSPFSSPSAFSAAPLLLPASSCASSRSYLCEAQGRRQYTNLRTMEHGLVKAASGCCIVWQLIIMMK